MMKILLITLSALFLLSCNSSSKKDPNQAMDDTARMDNPPANDRTFMVVEKMDITSLPVSIKTNGKADEAWKWNDSLGENILILSSEAPYDDAQKNEYGEEGQTAKIHATQFIKKGDRYDYIWMMNDEEKACPFDITCRFIPGSTTITDLDKDGFAEIKVQYMTACRSDVSPARMNLAMRENGVDYGLRGNSWIAYSPELKFDVTEANVNLELTPRLKDEMEEMTRRMGRYESERQFAKAPPAFITFARKEWVKYAKENMGE